jgi:restriction system protein
MNRDSTGTAALVDRWRELRGRTFAAAAGTSVGTSEVLGVSDSLQVNFDDVRASVTRPPTGEVNLGGPPPTAVVAAPELLLGIELTVQGDRHDDGVIIIAVTPAWRHLLDELASNPAALAQLHWRQMEELVAGAYREAGWAVTLTPRSDDRGRDVVATRSDIGTTVRLLDQVKAYSPGHLVKADEVRAMYGVLTLDQRASKAVVTTTTTFAPGVYQEFSAVTPERLELRDGNQLQTWLQRIATKR